MKFQLFLILLIIAFFSCCVEETPPTTTTKQTTTTTATSLSPIETTSCNIEDVSICETIPELEYEQDCYQYYAIKEKNLSLCYKARSIDNCIREIAIAEADPSLCNLIWEEYMINNCYKRISIKTINESVCEKIENNFSRKDCIRDTRLKCPESCSKSDGGNLHEKGELLYVYKDYSSCLKAQGGRKTIIYDRCVSKEIMAEYYCSEKQLPVRLFITCGCGEECIDGACVNKTTTTISECRIEDPSICDTIQQKNERYSCFMQYALDQRDPSICREYLNNSDNCYLKVAAEKEDLTICYMIHDQSNRNRCYSEIAKARSYLPICDLIIDPAEKENCYIPVAYEKRDKEICDNITNQSIKDKCISSVALVEKRTSFCDMIQDLEIKDKCYNSIACATLSPSICDTIQDQKIRDSCYNYIAYKSKDKEKCVKIQDERMRQECKSYSEFTCYKECTKRYGAGPNEKGFLYYQSGSGCPTTTAPPLLFDYCASEKIVVEYDCDIFGLDYTKEYIPCSCDEICVDGACIKKTETTTTTSTTTTTLPDATEKGQTSDTIKIIDHENTGPATFDIIFINSAGITITGYATMDSAGSKIEYFQGTRGYTIAPGEKINVTLASGKEECTANKATYNITINVTWENSITGKLNQEKARIWGLC